jgi:hypothetical protein
MSKKIKSYNEAELIRLFGLKRLTGNNKHPLMQQWLNTSTTLNTHEQYWFEEISKDLGQKIIGWNEEMLKMNFISFILRLGHLVETEHYKPYFESLLSAEVEGHFLKVKTDMMIASGIMEYPDVPYFYFQEYKKAKDPKGDVTAQLLEAFLIAQAQNLNSKPLYGCTVVGKFWEFAIFENKTYCISDTYDATKNADLLQIIAILRHFKHILDTKLLDV